MRIVIAEDEMLERKAMRKFLEDNFQQIEVVGEAVNGRQAIEMANKLTPDVMLVDIKMPGINGLEAISVINGQHPSIKFILVSAYDSFDYAKQAMKMGVKEYILKPGKKEETIRAILRVQEEIDKEANLDESRIHAKEIAGELLITRLTQFDYGKDIEKLREDVIPDMVSGAFLVANGAATVTKRIENRLENEGKLRVISLAEEQQTILLLSAGRQIGKPDILRLSRLLQTELGQGNFVGAGYSYDQLNDLPKSYYEAMRAAKLLAEMGKSRFGFPPEESKSEFPMEEILLEIASGREKNARYLFHNAWKTASASLHPSLQELFFRIKQLLDNKNIQPPSTQVEQLSTEQDWFDFIQQTCLEVMYHFQSQDKIQRAKRYIADHYSETVNLETVADLIDLSPNYFSNLFKDTTGATFVDYLTDVRMKKAEELLQENRYNLKEISYMVGYKDPNYFSRVFKKTFQVSPKAYQREILKK